jgi:ATP-dependent Lon protease
MAESYALLPLRGVLVYPGMVVPLEIGRPKSVSALEEAVAQEGRIVFLSQKDPQEDQPGPDDLYDVGVLAEVRQVVRLPGTTVKALAEGIARVRAVAFEGGDPHYRVQVEVLEEVPLPPGRESEALVLSVIHLYERYMKLARKIPEDATVRPEEEDPSRLADVVAANLEVKTADRQALLAETDVAKRLERLNALLTQQIELLELERKINARVRRQMEKTQKEYYLREQMKAIQRELGDREESQNSEAEEYRQKVEASQLPAEAKEKALREVNRLERMPAMSAEAVVVRNYLDWLTALPWQEETPERIDLEEAQRVLDEDHTGLEKVKERIIEYLAVRKLVPESRGPILCLVGPPGVGKTSLGRSVARALGRRFVRVSLGGIRDEAEIRGHRRTYVGALPGRIMQGIRQAGTRNPVFLLDEIDKLAADFRGDPAAALLEVLDPEQNHTFSDHFIEIPFDLSHVLFITTANNAYAIPRPLLDRMEVLEMPGYTELEKVAIAENHLWPRALKEHGLAGEDVTITREAIQAVIQRYTREAGVRTLGRELATICRKIATRRLRTGETAPVVVRPEDLAGYLGPAKYRPGRREDEAQVGVATAVYWTEAGGDVMPIEVTVVPGKGKLILTGKLGEVMRESAQAGFSYIRAHAEELGIAPDFHEKTDVHIHVPEGATPKEGPSAGITMATALASALSGRPVRSDVAMTGEITLRGRVLPVGGLREKILAAHRVGIGTIILPKENEQDLAELPASVREAITVHFVETMDEVLAHALLPLGDSGGRS